MCGIVGYIGEKSASPILYEGLKRLEYRGYDSAGVAVYEKGETRIIKKSGRLSVIEEELTNNKLTAKLGIGHTRWATHGKPTDNNAHPHTDCKGEISLIHNGIIENYQEIQERLETKGHKFKTEVDTEVICHLIEEYYEGDLVSAVRKVLKEIRGSFALAIITDKEPDKMIAVRKDSPLILGLGEGENFIASDIPAILHHTRKVHILKDGEMAVVTKDEIDLTDFEGNKVELDIHDINWDAVAAEKGGYPHFMLKEIHEQPRALKDTMTGRIDIENKDISLDKINITKEDLENIDKIFIVACGTSYHAGLVGKNVIEKLTKIPVEIDVASEYRYNEPMVNEKTMVIIISQSGETADTLAALRESKRKGARIVAITNVVGSSVAREAEDVLYTWAGPEIAVASTKAYTTQLLSLYMLAIKLALIKESIPVDEAVGIMKELKELPQKAQKAIDEEPKIKTLAYKYSEWENAFFIGRGLDNMVGMEGALKLKEISYIHAESYAAGELKHGTLALIVKDIPVISIITQKNLYEKMLSNMKEVDAREATLIAVAMEGYEEIKKNAVHVIYIPETMPFLTPVLTVIPLQLLAYYAAVARDCDVDKPRNLAKSVTVE